MGPELLIVIVFVQNFSLWYIPVTGSNSGTYSQPYKTVCGLRHPRK